MVFSSYVFVLIFLPAVLLGYYMLSIFKNELWQHLFLVGASLFFYGYFHVSYLLIMIASILVNYAAATLLYRTGSAGGDARMGITPKILFIAGIIFNIGLLGYFKYRDFFAESVNSVFGASFTLKHILLPLGISFFTFQQLSFLVSVYKREEKPGSFIDYCMFVTFFPQLVAGPIVLYSEMMPQFTDPARRHFNAGNFARGVYIFTLGLFKKAFIADTLAVMVDNGMGLGDYGLAAGWAVSLGYTLQLYFDFSGYSDMAIGIGQMFNIDLPVNFDCPYRSESISEFWRRWHITLGRALGTYIYIPLGGNRKGLARTCINLLITFAVSGLWHGAGWTFVIWGLLHGLIAVTERLADGVLKKIPHVIRCVCTFLTVNALWVLFRAESTGKALDIYRGMLGFGGVGLTQINTLVYDGIINLPSVLNYAYAGFAILILMWIVMFRPGSMQRFKEFKPSSRSAVISACLLAVSIICLSRHSVFIYFNF